MGTFNTKVEVLKLEMVDAIALYIKHNGAIEICDDSEDKFCSCCSKSMKEGYCINGGHSYYCSDNCMKKKLSALEIEELEIGSDESESYWTQWEGQSEYENTDSSLVAVKDGIMGDIVYHIVSVFLNKKSVVFKGINKDTSDLIEVNYAYVSVEVLAHICDSFI